MNFEMKLKIGETEFTIKEEVKSTKEFFEKAAFYSSIPTKGSKGGTNLVITYKCVDKDYRYYSILDKDTNMEFKFGQTVEGLFAGHKNKEGKYVQDWVPVYGFSNVDDVEVADTNETETPVERTVKTSTTTKRPPFVGKTAVKIEEDYEGPQEREPETRNNNNTPVSTSVSKVLNRFNIKRN
jgi:hypothetical protein